MVQLLFNIILFGWISLYDMRFMSGLLMSPNAGTPGQGMLLSQGGEEDLLRKRLSFQHVCDAEAVVILSITGAYDLLQLKVFLSLSFFLFLFLTHVN